MPRAKGYKVRNYPAVKLDDALAVASAIQDGASGMRVSKFTLAKLMDRSPSSSDFRELLLASRAYGLTEGGVNADHFELTPVGDAATGVDEVTRADAMRKAVLNVEPFRVFVTAYNAKKVPSAAALREFLVASAGVPADRSDDCIEYMLAALRSAGMLENLKGSDYVQLTPEAPSAVGRTARDADSRELNEEEDEGEAEEGEEEAQRAQLTKAKLPAGAQPDIGPAKKVFIAHGKNRTPLDQLKAMLDTFKVKYAVAIDEPNKGRPISVKVANLMRDECSSAIFIFTADERFLREDKDGNTEAVWRPSENVVYELGAASILYDRRIVIFKENKVTFPSDFSDLGYISFESDQLAAKMGDLFKELVELDVLEVRAKS